MEKIKITRPGIKIKNSQGTVLSDWKYEFQALAASKSLEADIYTLEKEDTVIEVYTP